MHVKLRLRFRVKFRAVKFRVRASTTLLLIILAERVCVCAIEGE